MESEHFIEEIDVNLNIVGEEEAPWHVPCWAVK